MYYTKDLQMRIRMILGLSSYERDRMIEALREAEGKEESARKAIIDAVVEDLAKRPAIEIRLRRQRDETL